MTGPSDNKTAPDFHGAAVVDENGTETPITEEMIVRACHELERDALGGARARVPERASAPLSQRR